MRSRCVHEMFFSSRRRHTRWNCDWSSDVCSSAAEATVEASSEIPSPSTTSPPRLRSAGIKICAGDLTDLEFHSRFFWVLCGTRYTIRDLEGALAFYVPVLNIGKTFAWNYQFIDLYAFDFFARDIGIKRLY